MGIRSLSSASIATGAKRSKFWDQTATAGYYDLIASTNVTTATATITFSNIPQTYSHLQLRISIRADNSVYSINYSSAYIVPNGNSALNYTVHQFYTDGASGPSASGRGIGSDSYFLVQNHTGYTAPTYHFGSSIVDIYNYTNTNHYKTMRSMGGADTTTPGNGWLFWNSATCTTNTDAITSLSITCDGKFDIGSSISLYGIK